MSLHANRRRLRINEEPDSEGSWAISYGDMVTLLLMFFILFFSTDKEADRFKALEAALLKNLSPRQASASGELYNLRVGDDDGDGIDPNLLSKWGGQSTKLGNKILVEFPDVSFYGFGEVHVNRAGIDQLRRFAQLYVPYSGNYILTIRAYTDTVPVLNNGNKLFKDNLDLSALRAVSALRTLQAAGIPLRRMKAEGYGEMRLDQEQKDQALQEAKSRGESGIKQARKVVLIIEPDIKDKL